MPYIVGRVMQLSEINSVNISTSKDRSKVNVLVIDDEGFEYADILRGHEFNVRVLKDIEDINAVKEYSIVVCDIKGVGRVFKSNYEGAHIIKEIHNKYPEKILIYYSAHMHDPSYNKYFKLCDDGLKKDCGIDRWVEALDKYCKKILSPIDQWYRFRDFLLRNDVPQATIFLLEQEYILTIKKRNPQLFARDKTIKNLSEDIKTVCLGFTSSLLFKSLIG